MTEIEKLLTMTYEECINYFLKKYGNVPENYFYIKQNNTLGSKNNKITRGNEGLYIHHIDEDKAILLSTPEFAKKNPIYYQKADRLIYCNLLEHLVLHIKIIEYPNPKQNKNEICGVGGIYKFIVPELNDIYSGITYKQPWKQKVVEIILPLKQDYLRCIKHLVKINFPYPLLNSFNKYFGWNEKNNKKIYSELIKNGVKK
ncbi:MAG: hypothetical protein SPLM_09720 [Spiroplasma phoeniceum]|uniref:hypothetical protein n=1 Tax=Spiroplasma phoeniceum TaxID=47835 RepID=UPI003133E0E3